MSGSSSNAGTSGWTLFMDALDEARASGATGEKRRTGRPKRHLADVEMRQLKQAEQIRRRLDKLLATQGPQWVPDQAFMDAHRGATQTIVQVSRSLRLASQAEREAASTMSDAEIDAAFLVQLRRIAPTIEEHQWRALLSAGLGADVAEAAISVFRQRASARAAVGEATQIRNGRPPTKGHG